MEFSCLCHPQTFMSSERPKSPLGMGERGFEMETQQVRPQVILSSFFQNNCAHLSHTSTHPIIQLFNKYSAPTYKSD